MILIASETHDFSTDEVCEWLNYYNIEYLRINENSSDYSFEIFTENNQFISKFITKDKIYFLSDFSVVWFRRGCFDFQFDKNFRINCFENDRNNFDATISIKNFCRQEFDYISEYLYNYLYKNAKCINIPKRYNVNKLLALEYATKAGLLVPQTLITKNKNSIDKVSNKLITKSISDWDYKGLNEYHLPFFTQQINKNQIPTNFFYSLFQQQVEKCFEVRTFIWDNKTYSAAIYAPPENTAAKTDFRSDYDGIKIVPYQLPQDIENKLLQLMQMLELESGSVDFIVDNELNFYFLEINPVGQFDFIDKACNYNLAKIIAETLIKYANN